MNLKKRIHDENIIMKNGKINTGLTHLAKFVSIYTDIREETKFLSELARVAERVYCIVNNIKTIPLCIKCNTNPAKFQGHFHNGKYMFCSQSCANAVSSSKRPLELRLNIAKKTAKIRRLNGTYLISPEQRLSMSNSAKNPKTIQKKRDTCKIRYGIENPGVLGAYSSKAATVFIKQYISQNNIDISKTYFKGGGVNDNEFFQVVLDPNSSKKKYVSYDLIVFKTPYDAKTKNLSKIDFILEYHGPWHYTESEAKIIGHLPAVPYKISNTIKESFHLDQLKLNHIYQFTPDVRIYWERFKSFTTHIPALQ